MSEKDLPLSSKKFLAYILAEISWKVALIVLLTIGMKESQIDAFVGSIALAIVIVAGAIEALYVGGQAALDKYTRIAEIATQNGQTFSAKDLSIGAKEPASPGKKTYAPRKPRTEKAVDGPEETDDPEEPSV